MTAAAAGAGLLGTWVIPRGPVTTAEALVAMATAVALGGLGGALLRSRWSAVLVPAVFVVVTEMARLPLTGPTVDGIRLGSVIGAAAFVAGRGVQALLLLLPMIVGALCGVQWAARRSGTRGLGGTGRVTCAVLALAVVALAGSIARPATTAPVVGPAGSEASGGIAELINVQIGGHPQALMIRGADVDNPVLLHLAGGPGGTDIGAMRLDTGLEQHFVVVTWDQRGTGKSYDALDPADTLTLDRVVADTLEVTDYLRERFGEERIFLAGQSWGTLPGALAVHRQPDRFAAFVGTGQMVDIAETDLLFFQETRAWAQSTGRGDLVTHLDAIGPPPYDDLLDYTTIVSSERDLYSYPEFDGSTEMPATIWVPENTLLDRVNAIRGLVDTYAVLYPQLQRLDLRETVQRLDVPVYLVMGEHEARGRLEPARSWFDQLEAPHKEWVEFPASSHRANFEQPALYVDLLTRVRDTVTGS